MDTPEDVTLVAEEFDPELVPWKVMDWPPGLPPIPESREGEHAASVRITGKEGKAVIFNIPFDSQWLFKQGEKYYRVFAVPAIPLMP